MSDEDEKLTKVGINWLACIYSVHQQNHYKMGLFSK